ncbi:MAG: hypothetical protein ACRD03_14750 [Acidimicrobiales bacterium]
MSNPVDRFLDAVRTAGFAATDVFADDALSDSTPPNWRLQMRGAGELSAQYAKWFDQPAELTELRRTRLPDGELLEYTRAWTQDRVPHKAHHIHRLTVAADRIVEDAHWCGGRWPESLLTEIANAGHKV